MKLLISVCDTKHVERGHRSLRFTVNEIVILSVTISYVKREWISVVNIPTVHPQQRKTTVRTMSWNNKVQYLQKLQAAWPINRDST